MISCVNAIHICHRFVASHVLMKLQSLNPIGDVYCTFDSSAKWSYKPEFDKCWVPCHHGAQKSLLQHIVLLRVIICNE